ncbi:MAG: T9SS type A sorting domain-containing protein, partial [Bacteroidota bacterium]
SDTPRKGIIPYGPWHDNMSLGPVGPWNHKWANKTLTPNNVNQWPGHERWYDLRSSPFNSEFTVHQNNGVAAMLYGFLKSGPGSYSYGDNNPPDDTDGPITLEAEEYTSKSAGSGNYSSANWQAFNDGQASNGQYMMVPDNNNQNANSSLTGPHLDYSVNIAQSGKHYLWVRMIAPNPGDDSCIPAIDGSSLGVWHTGTSADWTWKKYEIFNLDTGNRTLSIYMREDGIQLDKIILTDDAEYRPDANARVATKEKPLGLSEFEVPIESLKIYPNPAHGIIQIQVLQQATVQVYNSMGRLMQQAALKPGQSEIDVSKLSPGIYVVSTTQSGLRQSQRLILK